MTQYQSELVARLHPYVPGEQRGGADVVKLNTNENPYPPSSAVMQAISEVDGDTLRRYPDPEAQALCQSLADYHGVALDQVYVSNGSDESLGLAFMAFFTGKAPLEFPAISYSFYSVYCDLFAIQSQPVDLNNNFSLDLQKFSPTAGGVCFPNPNAPTGLAVSLEEIEALLQRYTSGVVLIDEAYADFGAESAISLIDKYPNLLVTQTFSKGRSLAGMRIGAVYGQSVLIAAIAAVKNSFNSYPVDALAQAAAQASIADESHHRNTINKIIATRLRLTEALTQRGFTVLPSEANFVFASPENVDIEAADLFQYLNENNVLVRYWPQAPIDKWLRISIGSDTEIDQLLVAIDNVVQAKP